MTARPLFGCLERRPDAPTYSADELHGALALFATSPRVTVRMTSEAIGTTSQRARRILDLIADGENVPRRNFGGRMLAYTVKPDASDIITAYLTRPQSVRRDRLQRELPGETGLLETYPSGERHHFATDWLGRVRYIGPVRRADDRWMLEVSSHQR